ncbi:MAG: hypothetical protein Q4F75_04280 [Pseudomonadota bacterium]|nr:hypothetical protein [Pseudomonadota bacterium]
MNFLKSIFTAVVIGISILWSWLKALILLLLLFVPHWLLDVRYCEAGLIPWWTYVLFFIELIILSVFSVKYTFSAGIQYRNRDIYIKYQNYFLVFCIVVNWGTYFVYRGRIPRTIEENLLKMITFF